MGSVTLEQLKSRLNPSGSLPNDIQTFLITLGCPKTATHSAAVAIEARRVAALAGTDLTQAEVAGWLHDISAVVPAPDRAQVARLWGIEVLPEEAEYPMIIHQKLSAAIAKHVFLVHDEAILSAIGCHTTLKAGASLQDKVLFVADKLAWDQEGVAPFHSLMRAALRRSVEASAYAYLEYLWLNRASLRVVHPWMRDAYLELSESYGAPK